MCVCMSPSRPLYLRMPFTFLSLTGQVIGHYPVIWIWFPLDYFSFPSKWMARRTPCRFPVHIFFFPFHCLSRFLSSKQWSYHQFKLVPHMHNGPISKPRLAISSSALVMWEPSLLYGHRCKLWEGYKSMLDHMSIWDTSSRSFLVFFYPSLAPWLPGSQCTRSISSLNILCLPLPSSGIFTLLSIGHQPLPGF